MRLYGSRTSPFVRKTLIVAEEAGIMDRVEFVAAEGSPLDPPGERAKNPLRKIPFLEMPDGRILFDSRVVAEAFIEAADESASRALLPSAGPERFDALTRQALSDGICDCAVAISYETRLRPEAQQSPDWLAVLWGKIDSGLDWLEQNAPPADRFDLGDCGLAGALPYLDFRFSHRDWRASRPQLAAWFEQVKARPSVAAIL